MCIFSSLIGFKISHAMTFRYFTARQMSKYLHGVHVHQTHLSSLMNSSMSCSSFSSIILSLKRTDGIKIIKSSKTLNEQTQHLNSVHQSLTLSMCCTTEKTLKTSIHHYHFINISPKNVCVNVTLTSLFYSHENNISMLLYALALI